ncbi:hypothetical protein Zmor_021876 [Zophobas morio]|uniref:Uncharacterized protein n=1 Tax=Zophobas morio TaxID=2755281 RepID=A0AA38I9H2_9CUCU|nr:hypothetical protein Zmor_021876 [Zophobas morio]
MAGGKRIGALATECKKCKKTVVDAVTCAVCGNRYHPSCAEIIAKVSTNEHFECCEKQVNDEADFWDAVENLPGSALDGKLFSYIIKQKDLLIAELRETIKLQNKHIETLANGRNLETVEEKRDKPVSFFGSEKTENSQATIKSTDT